MTLTATRPRTTGPDLYDPDEVRSLFDRMSGSYDRMNVVLSLGFSARWRRQLLELIDDTAPADTVVDLMSGRGETWGEIARRFPEASVTAVDFSASMVARSAERNDGAFAGRVAILHEDALASSIPDGSVDVVVSAFGLKTFDAAQSERLADEVARMLRPGGRFAFVDVTEPPSRMLNLAYSLYLRCVVPVAGTLLAADPTEYRMLHRYLAAYGDGRRSVEAFARHPQLDVDTRSHFFGCATSVSGSRRP